MSRCRPTCRVGLVLFANLLLSWTVGGSVSSAAAPDPFDLASINLHPVYLSTSNSRPAATLHAVATSRHSSAAVSIAVGDGGTILRSTDGGQTWNPIDRMTPLAEPPGDKPAALRFGAKRPIRRFIAIPFWHFYDVAWLSSLDVIIVGGAFEPVTGISRGVCLVSDDAGATWSMGNAHELPRLKRIVRRPGQPVGTVELLGDTSEASGINRFLSYDAGRTWVEANTSDTESPVVDEATPNRAGLVASSTINQAGLVASSTINQAGLVNSSAENRAGLVASSASDGPIQVGEYGRITIDSDGQVQTVRGGGRHAAVALVAASPRSVAWSLAGRESLHENRRVVMALADPSSDRRTAERVADAAKLIGVTVCDRLHSTDPAELQRWLDRHRPAVVVLDDTLPDEHHRSWIEAIARTRQGSSAGHRFPQRVLVSRTSSLDLSASRYQSIWKRSSILRADALLTGPATLAGDFAADAWMIAAPGCPTPASVEIATLDDLSGTVRRDIALAAGLRIDEGQTRIGDEVYVAANRRLQIATARVSQTANLQNQLAAVIEQGTTKNRSAISTLVHNALAVTAPEDRTRLLWGQLTQAMRIRNTTESGQRPGFAIVRDVLLQQLSEQASPASIRRWADWTSEMFTTSLQPIAAADIPDLARVSDAGVSPPGTTAGARATTGSPARVLSPFQVAPVGYDSPSGSSSLNTIAPTAILVPQTQSTFWQSSREVYGGLAAPKSNAQSSVRSPSQANQRVNWDFHPVVMAGRKIDLNVRSSSVPRVPTTAHRPVLDGDFVDTCWRDVVVVRDDFHTTKITHDAEYWYFAITRPLSTGFILQLDCEGTYLAPVEFQIDPSGNRRVASETGRVRDPRWYVANKLFQNSLPVENGQQQTEIAINRSDLPGPIHRIAVGTVAPDRPRIWQAMPDSQDWLSVRESDLQP